MRLSAITTFDKIKKGVYLLNTIDHIEPNNSIEKYFCYEERAIRHRSDGLAIVYPNDTSKTIYFSHKRTPLALAKG